MYLILFRNIFMVIKLNSYIHIKTFLENDMLQKTSRLEMADVTSSGK